MKISVVTPTLNSAATIGDTIKSVLNQSTSDLVEHIIIDGSSSDSTIDIINRARPEYDAAGWSQIVISEPDKGLYHAMSKGVAIASGDIVGILNSDDFFSSCKSLATIAQTMRQHPETDAVYGNIHYARRDDPGCLTRRYNSSIFSRRLMLLGFQPPHPTFYCRRHVYSRFGGYRSDYRIAGDFDFMLRAIYRGRISIRHVPEDLVTMRTGGATDRNPCSHLRGLWEHELAYRRNRIPSTALLDIFQLAYKLIQIKWH